MKHYCVMGYPVRHSLSPKIHNRAFRKLGIDARYEAVEVAPRKLAAFMGNFPVHYAGANVTIPHKVAVMRFLDALSPEARAIGAVNTIVNRRGKLTGYNTDVFGAMAALRKVNPESPGSSSGSGQMPKVNFLKGAHIVVLGAGGAARAVVYGLKKAGAQVTILNRTLSHAKKLSREFRCDFGRLKDFGSAPCDILINTTSVGMWPKVSRTPLPDFKKAATLPIVMDIIYRPRITKLLRDAKRAGGRIITGDKMFLAQAAASFHLWTRREFPQSNGGSS